MGVRHLETYVTEDVPMAFHPISLIKEVQDYQRIHNKKALIVFDVMSLAMADVFSGTSKEGFLGERFNIIQHHICRFMITLKKAGAELVFFMDGDLQEDKLETFMKRQKHKKAYESSINVLDAMRQGKDIEDLLKMPRFVSTSVFSDLICQAAKKFGKYFVSQDDVEGDLAIARYAVKKDAFAIFSSDTDFLIYEGNWRYFFTKTIITELMVTFEYDRKVFLKHIGLSYKELAFFSSLGGNDRVQYEDVRNFHYKLCKNKNKFKHIAKYIKELPPSLIKNFSMTSFTAKQLIRDVFGSYKLEWHQQFAKGLELYDIHSETLLRNKEDNDKNEETDIGKDGYYAILPLDTTILFVDLRICNYTQHMLRLMQKRVGIQLYDIKEKKLKGKIFVKESHDEPTKLIDFYPIYPEDVIVPPLNELRSDDEENDESLLNLKLKLMCWIISDTLNFEEIKKVEKRYVIYIITLYFLLHVKVIDILEADLLFLTIHHHRKGIIPEDIEYEGPVDDVAFTLNNVYRSFYHRIQLCLKTIGLDSYAKPYLFDSVYFHILYRNAKTMKPAEISELLHDTEHLRLYKWAV